MNKSELIENVTKRALARAQRSYDEPSRTHIIFCFEIGKFGTRGVGAFADDAFADFEKQLEIELASASEVQLNSWYKKLPL